MFSYCDYILAWCNRYEVSRSIGYKAMSFITHIVSTRLVLPILNDYTGQLLTFFLGAERRHPACPPSCYLTFLVITYANTD